MEKDMIKEIVINDLLSVALFKDGKVHACVAGKPVIQCVHVFITAAPDDKISTEIECIDQAIKMVRNTSEVNDGAWTGESTTIDADTALMGHASNIQAWAENDYDSRILVTAVAHPILEALKKAGDITAARKYYSSIAERWVQGNRASRKALIEFNNIDISVLGIICDDDGKPLFPDVDAGDVYNLTHEREIYLNGIYGSPIITGYIPIRSTEEFTNFVIGDSGMVELAKNYHEATDDDIPSVILPAWLLQTIEDAGGFDKVEKCMAVLQQRVSKSLPVPTMKELLLSLEPGTERGRPLDVIVSMPIKAMDGGPSVRVALWRNKMWNFIDDPASTTGEERIVFRNGREVGSVKGRTILEVTYAWKVVAE